MLKKKFLYFDLPSPQNTEGVLRLARNRANELKIRDIVVASTSGETAVKSTEAFRGFHIVVVSHHTDFKDPGVQQMTDEHRRKIERNGGKVLTGIHAFSGVERAIINKIGTAYPAEIMAQTPRIFGEGTKVAVEITVMAVDAGLIPIDKDIIAIAGTDGGADTALIIQPANLTRIFDLTIKEIIAKPLAR